MCVRVNSAGITSIPAASIAVRAPSTGNVCAIAAIRPSEIPMSLA